MDSILTIRNIQLNVARSVDGTDCWEWQGCLTKAGYGQIRVNNKTLYTHRLMYESYKGQLLPNCEIDHLCRNRKCCNPEHLEQVTRKINQHRGYSPAGVNSRRTHCKRGHELIPKNLWNLASGKRQCKICANDLRRPRRRKVVL